MDERTVLITGCSSGFGRLAAKTFHQRGWNVVATMRAPEREAELTGLDNMLVTRLDVTDQDSIQNAVDAALERFGAIDALVNNAGYGGHALFEQASDEVIRGMYETNVFGLMNVTRAVLPSMRRSRRGCVVNVTSMAGMLGLPGSSIYSSSKFAVEGLTEAMAIEYAPLNIRVRSVLPGAYPTTRFNASTDNELDTGDEQLTEYAHRLRTHIDGIGQQMATQGGSIANAQEVADLIWDCVTGDRPIHNPVGADAHMLVGMMEDRPRQEFLDELSTMLIPQ